MLVAAPRTSRRSRIRTFTATLITIALLVAVEYVVGWRSALSIWLQLSLMQTLPAAGLVMFSYILRGARLAIWTQSIAVLAHPFDTPAAEQAVRDRPFQAVVIAPATILILRHNLLNVLMPFRTGEAVFPLLMHRQYGIGLRDSLLLLLWLRLLDLLALLGLGLAAVAMSSTGPGAALLILSGTIIGSLYVRRASQLMVAQGDAPQHPAKGWRGWRTRLSSLLQRLYLLAPSGRDWWLVLVLGWLNWLAKLAGLGWILMLLLGCVPSMALSAVAAGELSSVLPVHGIAGAGTYEAGILAGLLPFGVATAPALKAAVNLHLFVLACAVIGGSIGFLPWRIGRPDRLDEHLP